MSSIKNKISRALESNSSKAVSGGASGSNLAGRTGSLRVVHGTGNEEYDESRHLGDLSLDYAPDMTAGMAGTSDNSRAEGIAGPSTGARTSELTAQRDTLTAGQRNGTQGELNQIVDKQIFTRTEDRQVVIKTVIRELHHRPIEKQYIVQTKYLGATRVAGERTEFVGTEARQIEERIIEAPAVDAKVIVENVDLPREMLQNEVVSVARDRATGTSTAAGTTSTTNRTSMAGTSGEDFGTTTGIATGRTSTPTGSSSTGGLGSKVGSKAAAAMAATVGKPYTMSQPGSVVEVADEVIDSHVFTKTEDHEVIVERTIYELHHRPVQKQYLVQTRLVGERRVAGAATEYLGTEMREVEKRLRQGPTGNRTVVVKNVDVPYDSLREETADATTGTTGTRNVSSASGAAGSPGTVSTAGYGSTTGPAGSSGARGMPTSVAGNGGSNSVPRSFNGTRDQFGQYGTADSSTMSVSSGNSGAAGMTGSRAVGGSTVGGISTNIDNAPVIDSRSFTKTEDHQVLVEKKVYELEHRPIEKEYMVETRFAGERLVRGRPTELVRTEARQVEERVIERPAADRAVVIENVDVPRETIRQEVSDMGSDRTMGGIGQQYRQ